MEEKCPQLGLDVESFLRELKVQLLRASKYWVANALESIRAHKTSTDDDGHSQGAVGNPPIIAPERAIKNDFAQATSVNGPLKTAPSPDAGGKARSLSTKDTLVHHIVGEKNFSNLTNAEIMKIPV